MSSEGLKRSTKVLFAWMVILVGMILTYDRSASAREAQPIGVYVDDEPVSFSVDPLLEDGTTLVQLRPLVEALGVELVWNAQDRTIRGTADGQSFLLTVDSGKAQVNGQEVTLEKAPRIVDGNTLIPLRFVSEATGAVVGWQGEKRTIFVYSGAFLEELGIDRETALALLNSLIGGDLAAGNPAEDPAEAPAKDPAGGSVPADSAGEAAPPAGSPSGLYAGWTVDVTGYCGGLCWRYYYFMPDGKVYIREPENGLDAVACTPEDCVTYEIANQEIRLGNGDKYPYEVKSESELKINNLTYRKIPVSDGVKLEGEYRSFSYAGNGSGGGVASESLFTFRKDGTFSGSGWAGAFTDGSDTGGDGSGSSTVVSSEREAAAGTYAIQGNTIELVYSDGTKVRKLFFLPEHPGTEMLHIGGLDFTTDEE
ncbi:hypothetical protein PM3016_4096 [Paenibacillus mucilaginosus 3016]|uniref:Copper amine oxidase-like N-terminal domain-containing protein n=3 Tax=Paenibacillus mucilaginosus TaxID=61624 RepID=H6NK25_9BACL|nr:copper amine oxidase N-terminal domain-containing protein [Paenibacillus mucilaginosus]AFC30878.1 hypothetical protein PM3016_4096 [Paenibacillus mucilaginosus 3016]WFA19479.1 hypothetical protein ERY13_20610 [Paenibacillus mucilaginosus]